MNERTLGQRRLGRGPTVSGYPADFMAHISV
jgi:hypothetical protein